MPQHPSEVGRTPLSELLRRQREGDLSATQELQRRLAPAPPPEEDEGRLFDKFIDPLEIGAGVGALGGLGLMGLGMIPSPASPFLMGAGGKVLAGSAAAALPAGLMRLGRFGTEALGPEDAQLQDLGFGALELLPGAGAARRAFGGAKKAASGLTRVGPRTLRAPGEAATVEGAPRAIREGLDDLLRPPTPPRQLPPTDLPEGMFTRTGQNVPGAATRTGQLPIRTGAGPAAGGAAQAAPTPAKQGVQRVVERVAATSPETAQAIRTAPTPEKAASLTKRALLRAQRLSDEQFVADAAPIGTAAREALEAGRARWAHRTGVDFTKLAPSTQNAIDRMAIEARNVVDDLGNLANNYGIEVSQAMKDQAWSRVMQSIAVAKRAPKKALRSGAALEQAIDANLGRIRQARKFTSDMGVATAELLARLGGAGIGATTGAAFGDTPEEQFAAAMMLGAGGAVAPSFFMNAPLKGRSGLTLPSGQKVADFITNSTMFNVLSSPDTLFRANFGGIGGMFMGLMERGMSGLVPLLRNGDPTQVSRVLKALREVPKEMGRAAKIVSGPLDDMQRETAKLYGGTGGRIPEALGEGVSAQVFGSVRRLLSWGDFVALNTLKKAGYSIDEATSFTLGGKPATELGRRAMDAVNAMGGPHTSPLAQGITKQVALFPRVGIRAMEGAFQRTPGLPLAFKNLRMGSPTEQFIRQAEGPALLGAGMAADRLQGDEEALGEAGATLTDSRVMPIVEALAGPGVLPFVLGQNLSRARRAGRNPASASAETFAEFSPLGRRPLGAIQDVTQEIPRRAVPSILADIARAMDPEFSRKTGMTELQNDPEFKSFDNPMFRALDAMTAGGQARVPGLRERFPAESEPVDFLGRRKIGGPLTDLPEGLERFIFPPPSQQQLPPTFDRDDPLASQLAEMGIEMGAPSGDVSIGGISMDIPAQTVPEIQRIRGVARERAVREVLAMPFLKQLPNNKAKRFMVQRLIRERDEKYTNDLMAILTALQGGAEFPDLSEPVR